VSRKWIAIIVVAVVIAGCIGYSATRFLYLLNRPSLGIMRGSASEAESRAAGFYVGTYAPARRLVSLKDLSIIHVPDAWVERAWKPELTFLLRDRRVVTPGYYLYIPIHPDDSIGSKTIWPFKFALKLDQQGQQLSRYPGIGYDATLGFTVFLDTLPDTVKFYVEQKQREEDTWNDVVPVETIEFKRGF
jgi:hypothetical protein